MRGARTFLLLLLVAISVPGLAVERVRIAVLGLFHPRQVVVEASPSSPMLVDSGRQQFVVGVGARQHIAVTRASGRKLIAQTNALQLSGQRLTLGARQGGDSEFFLSVPGKLRRRYRGKLIITAGERELFPVVEMELETAVASVVAAEMPGNTPLEALKAQAVVSRSYLISGGHRHTYADFCDSTHCQFLREPPLAGSHVALATRGTKGLVLAWKGKPFPAMYSASCGGRTHSLAEVDYAPVDYPYFAVECAYCRRTPDKWASRLSEKDVAALSPNDERERIKAGPQAGMACRAKQHLHPSKGEWCYRSERCWSRTRSRLMPARRFWYGAGRQRFPRYSRLLFPEHNCRISCYTLIAAAAYLSSGTRIAASA